jgi:GNAT superfamily N-acetyltransferase
MSTPTANYTFAVLDADNRSFPLSIQPADQRAKTYFQSVWKRMSGAIEEHHKLDKSSAPDWSRWSPWDWCLSAKPDVARRRMHVGWLGERIVGFVSLWHDFPSVATPGANAIYIEHIGSFPGNLDTTLWSRRHKGVGKALLAFAVKESIDHGFDGRLALHASNTDALSIYRSYNTLLGGRLFHPERTGVTGPNPSPQATRHDAGRTFLETIEAGAKTWLEGYRDA